MARQHLGKGALTTAIATHHRMDLPLPQGEVHPMQDGLVANAGMQVANLNQNRCVGANHSRGRGDGKTGIKREIFSGQSARRWG